MTLIHPFTSNCLDSNFLGVIYLELKKNNKGKVLIIVNATCEEIIKTRLNKYLDKIIFIQEDDLFPKFSLKGILIQFLKTKRKLSLIYKKHKITKLITENDCMSFSQMVLCSFMKQRGTEVEIYQAFKELKVDDYIRIRKKEYYKRYGKLKGQTILLIRIVFGQILLSSLYKMLFPNFRIPLKNYISRNCISGMYIDVTCFCYEPEYRLKRSKLAPNSITQLIPHSLSNLKIPLSILLPKGGYKQHLYYLFLIPLEITEIMISEIEDEITRLGPNKCSIKIHPSHQLDVYREIYNRFQNQSIRVLPHKSVITDYILSCRHIIDLSPEESTINDIINKIKKRGHNINYYNKIKYSYND